MPRWITRVPGTLSQVLGRVPGLVPDRCGLSGLSGVASLAGRFCLPRLWPRGGWRLGDGRFMCSGCGGRTSVTAGTIFDRTRTPLTVWFSVCWLLATGKDGISALSVKRTLEIGSYQTAWAMLHRLRSVLVRPGRDRLPGVVEVDETYIGGEEPGLSGGRAKGKKVLTGIAVERRSPRDRPVPHAAAGRRVGRLAALFRGRSRRAGCEDHHRWLAGLPAGESRLRP